MNKKNKRILLIIYIMAVFMFFAGSSMAYFTVRKTSTVSPKTDVGSATKNSIFFNSGGPISMYASPENFYQGRGNLYGFTYATATAKAGSDEKYAEFKYNLTLELYLNDFIYTTEDKTPELLLAIKDPHGDELTEIKGLNYVTVNGVSGFDITNKKGNYTLAENYEIKTENEDTHTWDAEIVFINLNNSQDKNKGKELNGILKIGSSD